MLSEVGGRVVALRREFHAQPELAFEEELTARRIIGERARLGIPSKTRAGEPG